MMYVSFVLLLFFYELHLSCMLRWLVRTYMQYSKPSVIKQINNEIEYYEMLRYFDVTHGMYAYVWAKTCIS